MALEDPQRLKSESERAKQKVLTESTALKTRIEAAERLSLLWKEYSAERKKTEEQLSQARAQYKEVLKRTEAAALSGQPRLYWFAKAMFAKLRRHSLEYQVAEAQHKHAALAGALEQLNLISRKLALSRNADGVSHLFDYDEAERKSAEHSTQMSTHWQSLQKVKDQTQTLQQKLSDIDVTLANSSALIAGPKTSSTVMPETHRPRVVDSEKMLTSRLPFVGFVNKTKLIALVEQGEYAAEHAERDLSKVRDGLKMASEAAVGGRATRMTRDWLEYCKAIVCRYDEQTERPSTPS